MVDVDKLSELVEWAYDSDKLEREKPETWNRWTPKWQTRWKQAAWSTVIENGHCKTFGCIAGRAVMDDETKVLVVPAGYVIRQANGLTVANPDAVIDRPEGYTKPLLILSQDDYEAAVRDGKITPIPNHASYLLGLPSFDHSQGLFDGSNKLGDVVQIARAIARDDGQDLNLSERVTDGLREQRHQREQQRHQWAVSANF